MKSFLIVLMLGLSIYYLSCESKNDSNERLNNILLPDLEIAVPIDCSKIILVNGIDPNYPVMDEYKVNKVRLNADTINIEVVYSGGCKDHSFCLIAWSYFLESLPVKANLLLSHNANDDNCEALVNSGLKIDLSPLKEEYINQYVNGGDSTGVIDLVIRISSSEKLNVRYEF